MYLNENVFKLFKSSLSFLSFCLCDTSKQAALQINVIPLPVTMNRKIKKPPVKLNFWQSQ